MGSRYRVDVDLALVDLVEHALGELGEELGDVGAGFGGGGEEGELGLGGGGGGRLDEVELVADEDHFGAVGGVVGDLPEPGVDAFEALGFAEVVDEYDSDGVLVVGAGDGPEAFLSCLDRGGATVSQIWILMILSPTAIFLVANYTPMVGLLSER